MMILYILARYNTAAMNMNADKTWKVLLTIIWI